ncbi:MAG TPA: hypothetical protein VFD47_08100 [Actinomycetota bacterium]|nr:hypothetical protein [Actinomycetota bacterium]
MRSCARPGGGSGKRSGLNRPRKNLESVDQTGAGPGEVRRAVDRHHATAARSREGRELRHRKEIARLLHGLIEPKATGHEDDNLRLGPSDLGPSGRARRGAGRPQHLSSPGETHHLRDPVSSREGGIGPLERKHADRFE